MFKLPDASVVLAFVLVMTGCGAGAVAEPTAAPTLTPRPTVFETPRVLPTALPTPVDGGVLTLGQPVTVTLPGGTFVLLRLTLADARTVTMTARALGEDAQGYPLDVVLDVLNADDDRVAYNDDHMGDAQGLAATDAQIAGLALAAGEYVVRVNSFNGAQAGEVEVLLEAAG